MQKRTRYDATIDRRIKYIEQIIQSNVKYVQYKNIDSDLLNFPNINYIRDTSVVYCKTQCSKRQLLDYISKFGEYESIRQYEEYEITFKNIQDADLCAISSNEFFLFKKVFIFTSFDILKELAIKKKIPVNGFYNENLPLDYYKLIIGPLENDTNEIRFNLLKKSLNDISPLFGLKRCINKLYVAVIFKEQPLVERIVEVLSKIKIKNNEKFSIKFAYENCLITDIPEIFNIPFVSSMEPTRVVFLFNANVPKSFILDNFPNENLQIVTLKYLTLIKCSTLELSAQIYDKFGGLGYYESTIISGYFPEFNFEIGDY
ncbi:U4/U6 snRNA-associated-splicing factor (PRP24) [Vairimorpha necatrix]|uniref:U4/U6 snRNA-associated-splicing factor (PRP24) n=1 Tax=Vairimorpha necatrix TaxID=6039 RepID=A0AAX4JCA5_9MICR